jgi:hypothetical protein
MLKICGRLKGLIPYRSLIFPQSRESAKVRAQPYSSGAHRPCSARAITLWIKLVKTIVYLRNKSPIRILNQLTLYKYLYKKKPDVSHLKIINLAIYYYEIKSESRLNRKIKLEPKIRKCRFIKYGKGII